MNRQVWLKPAGDLVVVEWNLCGCHPNDVSMIWGNRFGEAGFCGNQDKNAWARKLIRRGWERLGNL